MATIYYCKICEILLVDEDELPTVGVYCSKKCEKLFEKFGVEGGKKEFKKKGRTTSDQAPPLLENKNLPAETVPEIQPTIKKKKSNININNDDNSSAASKSFFSRFRSSTNTNTNSNSSSNSNSDNESPDDLKKKKKKRDSNSKNDDKSKDYGDSLEYFSRRSEILTSNTKKDDSRKENKPNDNKPKEHSQKDPKRDSSNTTPKTPPPPPRRPARVETPPQPTRVETPPQPTRVEPPPQPTRVEPPPQPTRVEPPPQPTRVETPPQPTRVEPPPQPTHVETPPQPTHVETPSQIITPSPLKQDKHLENENDFFDTIDHSEPPPSYDTLFPNPPPQTVKVDDKIFIPELPAKKTDEKKKIKKLDDQKNISNTTTTTANKPIIPPKVNPVLPPKVPPKIPIPTRPVPPIPNHDSRFSHHSNQFPSAIHHQPHNNAPADTFLQEQATLPPTVYPPPFYTIRKNHRA